MVVIAPDFRLAFSFRTAISYSYTGTNTGGITMNFERINPLTNTVASTAQAMTADEARAVADRAAAGFAAWSSLGPNARRAVLSKAATSLEARKDDFVKAMMEETGSTAGWAMFNLMLAAGMIREA